MAGDHCCRLDTVPWPGMLGLTREAQGCWSCTFTVGACLSGSARGVGTAGRGLPWGEAEGCPVGLRGVAQWPLGDTPEAASLGWNQDGGGRPRLAPGVPAA